MKKLYFIRTNGSDMLVSVDEEKNCRYLNENNEFPKNCEDPEEFQKNVKTFMESVEDDSSWDDDCSYADIFENNEESFNFEIIAEIESNC